MKTPLVVPGRTRTGPFLAAGASQSPLSGSVHVPGLLSHGSSVIRTMSMVHPQAGDSERALFKLTHCQWQARWPRLGTCSFQRRQCRLQPAGELANSLEQPGAGRSRCQYYAPCEHAGSLSQDGPDSDSEAWAPPRGSSPLSRRPGPPVRSVMLPDGACTGSSRICHAKSAQISLCGPVRKKRLSIMGGDATCVPTYTAKIQVPVSIYMR
jgi:hypothetical protein